MSARDALTQIPSTPVVIRREDYRPPTHRISNVKLQFTLDLERTQVINEFECESTGTEKGLHLYGDELSLVSVSVNGRPLESDEF
jgi:aminopeptidase N